MWKVPYQLFVVPHQQSQVPDTKDNKSSNVETTHRISNFERRTRQSALSTPQFKVIDNTIHKKREKLDTPDTPVVIKKLLQLDLEYRILYLPTMEAFSGFVVTKKPL